MTFLFPKRRDIIGAPNCFVLFMKLNNYLFFSLPLSNICAVASKVNKCNGVVDLIPAGYGGSLFPSNSILPYDIAAAENTLSDAARKQELKFRDNTEKWEVDMGVLHGEIYGDWLDLRDLRHVGYTHALCIVFGKFLQGETHVAGRACV